MKNTNSELENSVLVYTHVAFIVKITTAEFHIICIKMVMLKDFLKRRTCYSHWIKRKVIGKSSKTDIQLFDKTIPRNISYMNLLVLQCKMRLSSRYIKNSYNFTMICDEIWLCRIQQHKHPASYHKIFTLLLLPPWYKKTPCICTISLCQTNSAVHFRTSCGNLKMFLE